MWVNVMKGKYIFYFILLPFIVYAETIENIINTALKENPKLKSIQYELKSYKQREIFVSSFQDPILTISVNDIQLFYKPLSRRLEPMQTINLGISQKIPWLKKFNIKRDIIKKKYDERYYYLLNLKQEILFNIYKYAYEYWEIKEKLKIIREYEDIAKHLIDLSNTLYSVGKVSQTDVFNSHVFYYKLKEREKRLLERKKAILSKIQYYTSSPVKDIEINPVKPFELDNLEKFKAVAKEKNPELKVYKRKIEVKNKELKLAKLDYKPDFKFFANYSYRNGYYDYVSVGVSFNIPVWKKSRQDRKVLEITSLKSKEERNYQDVINRINSQLEESFYNGKSFYESYKIFNDYLLIQTKNVYESVISEYQVGRKNIFDVLKALNQILDVKIKMIELTAKFNISYQRINKLIGEIK